MGQTTVIPPVVGLAVLALVFMGALVDAHASKEEGEYATRNLSVEESEQLNFLTVAVPLRAEKTARIRIFSGDQLHEKVRGQHSALPTYRMPSIYTFELFVFPWRMVFTYDAGTFRVPA